MTLFFDEPTVIGGKGKWNNNPFRFYNNGEPWILGSGKVTPDWREVTLSGEGALTLTNALANSLLSLKLFGATEQRNLPSGYTQVEYLESSGTQYIDTGIMLPSTFHIKMKIKFYSFDPQYGFICGARNKNATTGRLGITLIRQGKKLGFDIDEDISHRSITSDLTLNTWYTVEFIVDSTGSKFLLDGTLISAVNTKPSTVNYPLYIFDSNTANATTDYMGAFDLCDFQINGLANYIASRDSDNVLGMYDIVTGNFLTNQGTGTFTAGADVTPTPDAPIDIVCNNGVVKVSKNLFDTNQQFANGYIDDNGNLVDFKDLETTVNYIPVLPNTDYTVSFTALKTVMSNFNISTWTSNGTIIGRPVRSTIKSTGQNIYTFTTTATTAKIKVTIWSDPSVITNFQIEQGSTATPYMPYGQIYVDGTTETVEIDTTGDTATAENLFKVGDYQDVQSVIDGGVTRQLGIKVLDGTEEVRKVTSSSAPLGYYFGVVTNTPHIQSAVSGYCTNFTITSNEARWLSDNTFALGSNARMWFSTSKFTEVSDFQQWLADQYSAGTPCIVIYPLSSPIMESISPQPLTIQQGTNIIEITEASINNLPLEVSYKAGVSVTITEIQNAQLDNNVEVTING